MWSPTSLMKMYKSKCNLQNVLKWMIVAMFCYFTNMHYSMLMLMKRGLVYWSYRALLQVDGRLRTHSSWHFSSVPLFQTAAGALLFSLRSSCWQKVPRRFQFSRQSNPFFRWCHPNVPTAAPLCYCAGVVCKRNQAWSNGTWQTNPTLRGKTS